MRFMILLKSNASTEAGVLPDEKLLAAMGRYNEELVKAGVLLSGEGLRASAKGARVHFSGSRRTVVDGPFAETKELIAGFWILQVSSRGRSCRMGEALSQPPGRGRGDRDPPGLRSRRFRPCFHSRAPGRRGARGGADEAERGEGVTRHRARQEQGASERGSVPSSSFSKSCLCASCSTSIAISISGR